MLKRKVMSECKSSEYCRGWNECFKALIDKYTIPVECKCIRRDFLEQIKLGEEYKLNRMSLFIDSDGDAYADIYDQQYTPVGTMNLKNFILSFAGAYIYDEKIDAKDTMSDNDFDKGWNDAIIEFTDIIFIPVKCQSIRNSVPSQIKVGERYFLNRESMTIDRDGDIFIDVYDTLYHNIGRMNISHFTSIK